MIVRIEDRLHELASAQHGLVTVRQALDLGLSSEAIKHRLTRGSWQRTRPTVLRLAGTRASDDQSLMTAVLDAGTRAVVSHWTAASHWGIPGFAGSDIHVSRLRATTARPARSSTIHEPRTLPDHHLTVLRDIPVTTPTRTIFDLAGVASPGKVERALDTAWSRRLLSGISLHAMLAELAERGRTGISVMRQLLKDRPPDYTPMDSGTEVRAMRVLADAGIRSFDHQVDLGDDREWLGRIDLVDRKRRIVIEIDSALYHGALIDKKADELRTARLEAAGYVVRRVTDTDVWHRPIRLVRTVRDARRAASERDATET
jgi:very-short-patch-repair endonuclease